MKIFFYLFALFILLMVDSCTKEANHKDCALIPDVGNCKASIPRYYFDKTEKKCKVFYWGGCDGVVPFETFEDCNKKCPCHD
ncbi:MAG: BPTI/Kunitz domain-containing protein [Saprospiraceae bacterium]|nr:BPTI/Kunitz domain-containing protein [Saprospiraceae bacterium]